MSLAGAGCYSGLTDDQGSGPPSRADGADEDAQGDDGGEDTTEPRRAEACSALSPGPAPVRRLTRQEYDNTVLDLLGDASSPAQDFVGDAVIDGFDNAAAGASTSRLLVEQYEAAADELAATAVADLTGLLGCDPTLGETECVSGFIAEFGARAYRHPLSDEEQTRLLELYEAQRADADITDSVQLMLSAMLQSPHFLYRLETGDLSQAQDGIAPLTDFEIASRLSYLLWNTMPDDLLWAAAEARELHTPEQIAEHTQRMLDDDRAGVVLLDFHEQWLSLRGDLPSALGDLEPVIRAEAEAFLADVIVDGDGRLSTLLSADYTFVNRDLAELYGIDGSGLGDDLERVELDPTRRAGLLTSVLVMSTNAEEHETSPIKRGRFVREQLLCDILPPPPPGLEVEPPEPDPNKTTRERYAQHREDPSCNGCHSLIDPIGFAFEHYDHLGRWRDDENGLPIDASGEITGPRDPDLEQPFDGAIELAHLLADSPQVEACAVRNWFRYAYGRHETVDDVCTLDSLTRAFINGDGSVRDVLLALTQTDAFRYVPVQE